MAHGTRTRRLKTRIMLVEDDMLLAQSLTDRLEGQGFHVDESRSRRGKAGIIGYL